MKKVLLLLLIVVSLSGAVFASNLIDYTSLEDASARISSWFNTEKGELFVLKTGETKEIKTRDDVITVTLLEIGYNPSEVSDLRIDDVVFSDDTPGVGESVHITVPVTNLGTGTAYNVGLNPTYGDEDLGHGHGGIGVFEIAPGETVTLELDHMWEADGIYTTIFVLETLNDIDTFNNVECKEITVGSGGSESGGCIGLGPNDIPKKAHLTYRSLTREEEFWLNPDDLGSLVDVLKLNNKMALLTVPM